MENKIPSRIRDALKNVVKEDLEDFEVTLHDSNKKGDGFLGEMTFITLKNQKSRQVHDLVVKQAFNNETIRDVSPIRSVYLNEISFYTKVWPELNEFQQRIPTRYQFQKIPKCFTTISDEKCELLVLENLKRQNFEVYTMKKPLTEDHFALILKEYGKFHALSFAYKELYPEYFAKLAKNVTNVYTEFSERDFFKKVVFECYEVGMESLQPGVDDNVIEAYKMYPSNCLKLFMDSNDCETKYTTLVHGDCWSNNMMFSYDETKKVTDVRFLDFQMMKLGSPCCDLSYCIYAGASKEILQDLDHYLGLYHHSLSETLRAFGCDPEELYPLKELKRDWKKYCKFGLTMGLMIWRVKTTYENELKDFTDGFGEDNDVEILSDGYDREALKNITREIILHLYKNDFL